MKRSERKKKGALARVVFIAITAVSLSASSGAEFVLFRSRISPHAHLLRNGCYVRGHGLLGVLHDFGEVHCQALIVRCEERQ